MSLDDLNSETTLEFPSGAAWIIINEAEKRT